MTQPGVINRPPPNWPPACVAPRPCGFVGEPGEDSSPYIACGGHLRRHWRMPVAERFRTQPVDEPVYEPPDRPAAVQLPAPPPRPPRPRTWVAPPVTGEGKSITRQSHRYALNVGPCDTCGARPGADCQTRDGRPSLDAHAARRTDARNAGFG